LNVAIVIVGVIIAIVGLKFIQTSPGGVVGKAGEVVPLCSGGSPSYDKFWDPFTEVFGCGFGISNGAGTCCPNMGVDGSMDGSDDPVPEERSIVEILRDMTLEELLEITPVDTFEEDETIAQLREMTLQELLALTPAEPDDEPNVIDQLREMTLEELLAINTVPE
jgi:hypothetical protein